ALAVGRDADVTAVPYTTRFRSRAAENRAKRTIHRSRGLGVDSGTSWALLLGMGRGGLAQGAEDGAGHTGGSAVAGVDAQRRELAVAGGALDGQLPPAGHRVLALQQRAARAVRDPAGGDGLVHVEPDHRGAAQPPPGLGVQRRAPAQGQHSGVLTQGSGEGRRLELPEGALAVGGEDLRYGPAVGLDDQGVEICERDLEPGGAGAPDAGLPRGHRAGEGGEGARHGARCGRRSVSADCRARVPSRWARISATESPPVFSSRASARVSATTASAITAAGATAQVSERWWLAVVCSPVETSTVRRARGTVEIGFRAPRTRITWPLVMPPSMPPARLVTRGKVPEVSSAARISSWAAEPRRPAVVKPSPISTPFMAWIDMIAWASRPSSRRSHWMCEPSPTGA